MPVHCSSGAAPSMPPPTAVYNRGMAAPESRYHRLQLLLGLTKLALGAAYLAAVLLAGGGRALAAFAFAIALTAVLPVWVLPLFYRLTPLADATLSARLLALADRAGVSAIGVWIADQSRKSRTANAAVIGLGRTRRILLYDTLTAG